jgi:hypothetical protein
LLLVFVDADGFSLLPPPILAIIDCSPPPDPDCVMPLVFVVVAEEPTRFVPTRSISDPIPIFGKSSLCSIIPMPSFPGAVILLVFVYSEVLTLEIIGLPNKVLPNPANGTSACDGNSLTTPQYGNNDP